jgi:hypothetical protein
MVVAVASALIATGATAAIPKRGDFYWCGIPHPAYPDVCNRSLDFDVGGDPKKVRNLYFSDYHCGGGETKVLNINDRGKFRFDGVTKETGISITIEGKFVTPRRAEGTIEMDCEGGLDGPISDEFVAKRQSG